MTFTTMSSLSVDMMESLSRDQVIIWSWVRPHIWLSHMLFYSTVGMSVCLAEGSQRDGVAIFYKTDELKMLECEQIEYFVENHPILDKGNVGRLITHITTSTFYSVLLLYISTFCSVLLLCISTFYSVLLLYISTFCSVLLLCISTFYSVLLLFIATFCSVLLLSTFYSVLLLSTFYSVLLLSTFYSVLLLSTF